MLPTLRGWIVIQSTHYPRDIATIVTCITYRRLFHYLAHTTILIKLPISVRAIAGVLDDLLLPDGCHVGKFFDIDMPLSEMVAC